MRVAGMSSMLQVSHSGALKKALGPAAPLGDVDGRDKPGLTVRAIVSSISFGRQPYGTIRRATRSEFGPSHPHGQSLSRSGASNPARSHPA